VRRQTQPKNHGFRPPSYYANFEEEEDGTIKIYGSAGNNSREGGRIIMLGDGTEVLTDSDDTEMFDYDEEEGDTEVLDKEGKANENKTAKEPSKGGEDGSQPTDKTGQSKGTGPPEAKPSKPETEKVSATGSDAK